ncbi:MAG: hypothetical protein JOZ81_33215 [Chloroflexi bacterium]|nr:hypothetical protein [Chloroflexota bacterium]
MRPSTRKKFYGAGRGDTSRTQEFIIEGGEPAVLLGTDIGANPAEALLHAVAACLTTSLVYVAAAAAQCPTHTRGVQPGRRHGPPGSARILG